MRNEKSAESTDEITIEKALDLWMNKVHANNYSQASIRNTKQQYNMITKFWSPEANLKYITEDTYLELISKCGAYGYSEETVYNINACLKKLVKLAYRNRLIEENMFDYCENARFKPKTIKTVITYEEYLKLDQHFAENSFIRQGEDCYLKYRLLLRLLYWTGMRIGEVIALVYDDFEELSNGKMKVSVSKSYNSAYKLMKGTKNDKTRKISLPKDITDLYNPLLEEHLKKDGKREE